MKFSLKKAQKGQNNFDLSSTHLTTMDFGSIQPTYFAEVLPNDVFHVNMKSFARLAPMAVPTFGNISCTSRAFFIPMRSLWKPFEDFISRSNDASLSSSIPAATNQQFVNFLRRFSYLVHEGTSDYDGSYDFEVRPTSSTRAFYNFTSRGRWMYKVLLSLGYSFNFGGSFSGVSGVEQDTTLMSLLPLMAFIRVFYDYIFPSQYVNGLGIGSIFEIRDIGSDDSSIELIFDAFAKLLSAPYSQDYFTSAWRDPNSVGPSDNVTLTLPANSPGGDNSNSQVAASTTQGVYIVNREFDGLGRLDSYGLRVLSSLNDFVTRNNIAGSRYFEQLLARFGVTGFKANPDRSSFIRSVSDPVSIIDVTATASTSEATLGEQGAKGIQSGDNHQFSISSQDSYGYIIILSHVMPNTGYYQGRKRHTLHLNVLDWFTPEFEKVGLQPIRNDEAFADYRNSVDYINGQSYGGNPNGVFGFAPRYIEYKKQDDYLTGDFRVPSLSAGLNSYHMFRQLPVPSSMNPLALNSDFLLCKQHEFDRIFNTPLRYITKFGLFDYIKPSAGSIPAASRRVLSYDGHPIIFVNSSTNTYYVISWNDITHNLFFAFTSNLNGPTTNIVNSIYSNSDYVFSSDISGVSGSYLINGNPDSEGTVSFNLVFSPKSRFLASGLTRSGGSDSAGYEFFISSDTLATNTFLSADYKYPDVLGQNTAPHLPVTSENFLTLFQDYFDHFYSIFRFDITASRPMLSISDSMPIEDGGSKVSVDYEGFNFSV